MNPIAMVTLGIYSAAPVPGGPEQLGAVVDRLAAAAIAEHHLAGVSVAVAWKGQVLARGYGMADVATRTPVVPETVFRIGSITKQFTAAAVMLLAAEHRLSIDDPLSKYVPELATAKRVTLRQLLDQTSGIPSYTDLVWFHQHMADTFPRAELVRRIGGPLLFDPGTRWSYSNSNYYLLAMVVEKASGQQYADFLRDRVFARAGLSHTRYCPDAQDYPRAAHGYRLENDKLLPAMPLSMAHPFGAGALCSTASDLVSWSRALVAGKVVDGASWKAMTTPAKLLDGTHAPYGFGLALGELDGHPVISHGGGINGFASALAHYPGDDLTVAVLVNTVGPFADQLGEQIARALLGLQEPEVKDLPVSAAEAAPLAGRYRFTAINLTLEVSLGAGGLVANDGRHPPVRLRSQGGGVYRVPEIHATVTFAAKDGRAQTMHLRQGGTTIEGSRVP